MTDLSRSLGLLFLPLAFGSGCSATRGGEFSSADVGEILVGTTRRDEILNSLGEPYSVGFAQKNQFSYPVYAYVYTEISGSGVRSRQLRVGFSPDDRVAFYRFESNFAEDSTDFDMTRVKNLVPGRSTAREILEAFGEPSGRDFAFVDGERYDVWLYGVLRLEDVDHPVLKRASFYFDSREVLAWCEATGEGFTLDD